MSLLAIGVASGAIGAFAVIVQKRRLKLLENAFRDRRANIELPYDYQALAIDDQRIKYFEQASPTVDALLACGFVSFGDVAIEPGGSVATIGRVMVSPQGTTFASILIPLSHPSYYHLVMSSYTADGSTVTLRADRGGILATPPTSQRGFVARGTSVVELFRLHQRPRFEAPLVTAATLADLIELMRRDHFRNVAWREGQPVEELLAADLRLFFGDRYARWVPRFTANLRNPPKATARRKEK